MPINTGDAIPAVSIQQATPEGAQALDTQAFFAGRTVVLFGVPGAFTPTCSAKHMPGFLAQAAALKAKGVEAIACMAVNDPFVLSAWARDQGVTDQITMIADGSALFTRALGLELDLSARGMGLRCQRFALIARQGRVVHIGIEAPGGFEASTAEAMLAAL